MVSYVLAFCIYRNLVNAQSNEGVSVSRVPEGVSQDALTVVARRVLLDALDALTPHLQGVTVAGAQAVYLRSQEVQLPVAAATSDGDLALTPHLVDSPPAIEAIMASQGFVL